MRWVLVLMMAAGCRPFFGLDPPNRQSDAGGDGPGVDVGDGPIGGTCIERWQQGPQFTGITALAGVNTSGNEVLPFITQDGGTLYFVRDGAIYTATGSVTGGFANATMSDLSSGQQDGRVYVSPNGLRAFLSSNRSGTAGGSDLWRAHRAALAEPWSFDQMYLGSLDGAGEQNDPQLTDDLLHIYFTRKGMGISYAARATINDSFPVAVTVQGIADPNPDHDSEPTITADERVIVFTSDRDGNPDLWYATRPDTTQNFSAPIVLAALNVQGKNDNSPFITPDGCYLLFASDRASSTGSQELYVASLRN